MKIKMSKVQWEGLGKKAGWIKEANDMASSDEIESPIDMVNNPSTDMKTLLDMAKNPATGIDVLSAIIRNSLVPPAVKKAVFNNPTYVARRESLM